MSWAATGHAMKEQLLVIAMAMATATVGVASAAPMKGAAWVPIVSAQLSPQQRRVIVDQIVRKWGPFVESVHKTSASAWTKRMGGTFAAANDANLQRAAGMKTFQGMMDALTGQQVSDARVMASLATQAQVLGSSPHQALLGSTASDLVYTPLAPCRIVDTRVIGGPITGGTSRGFHGYTSTNFSAQGGTSSSDCGIPANPSALMINVTVVSPTAPGYLTVFPFGTTQPLASNLNYGIGTVAGNEIAAKMTIGSATDEFSVFAFGSTNIVVDVVGYFMAPQATAVDCTTVSSLPVAVPNTGVAVEADAPSCPTNYTLVSTGCTMASTVGVINTVASGVCFGLSSVSDQLTAQGVCCRVPGR